MNNNFLDDNSFNKSIINNNKEINNETYIKNEFAFNNSFNLSDVSKIDINDEKINLKNDKNNHINNNYIDNIDVNISLESLFISKNNLANQYLKVNKGSNKKKLRKEDLNNIPLPIFSCIYCSNDKLSFKHLSNEILTNKYLFQTSIFDLKELDILINYNPKKSRVNQNNKLIKIFIKNLEYINRFYNKKEINYFFNLKISKIKCIPTILLNDKKYQNIIEKEKKKETKNIYLKYIKNINNIHKNKSKLFYSRNLENYYTKYNLYKKYTKGKSNFYNAITQNSCISNSFNRNNLSFFNLKSKSNYYNKNKINSLGKIKTNNKKNYKNKINSLGKIKTNNKKNLESMNKKSFKIVQDDKSQEERKLFLFIDGNNHLKRKITKNDIEWEKDFYDIYNPIINDDLLLPQNNVNEFYNRKIDNQKNIYEKNKKSNLKLNKYIHSENNIFKNSNKYKSPKFQFNRSFKDKNNKSSSFLLKKKNDLKLKILEIKNINFNINKRYNLSNIQSPKKEYNLNNNNNSPLYSKIKLKNLYSKSEKKITNIRSKKIIKLNKNILVNYITNIKNNLFYSKSINKKIKNNIHNISRNNTDIKKKIINYNKNNFDFLQNKNCNIQNDIISKSDKRKKYNLLLSNNNYNFNNNLFNKSLFNKSNFELKTKPNELQYNKFNLFFDIKNNLGKSPIKNKIKNLIYLKKSLIELNKRPINIKYFENEKNHNNNKF